MRAWITTIALVLVAGCSDEGAFDVIVRQGDRALPSGIDTLSLVVRRTVEDGAGSVVFDEETPALHDGERLRPWTVRVHAPDGSESRVFFFRADGLVAGTSVVAAEARLAFLAGSRLSVSLVLGGTAVCDADAAAPGCTPDSGPPVDALVTDAARDDVRVPEADASSDLGAGNDAGGDATTSCRIDRDCDDSMPCTSDRCVDGTCEHDDLDAVPCDDGDACTTTQCRSGACALTGSISCASGPCSFAYCDPEDGMCVDVPHPAGTFCGASDPCSPSSVCDGAGACMGVGTCGESASPCRVAVCGPSGCEELPVMDGTLCAGGRCCDGACRNTASDASHCGACASRCSVGTSCLVGTCASCTGDAQCNDGLACTTDSCLGGTCQSTVSTGCLIEGTCHVEGERSPRNGCLVCSTDVPTRWSAATIGLPCDDGLFCTQDDTCHAEAHCSGRPGVCATRSICTITTCNETSDRCESTPLSGRQSGCDGASTCCDGTCVPAVPGCS